MSWRIRIRHRSGYHYAAEVTSSYNEARVTPLPTANQLTLDSRLEISPSVRPYRYVDYWGTIVDVFDVQLPHTELTVIGEAVVETSMPAPPDQPLGWDALTAPAAQERWVEFLSHTDATEPDPAVGLISAELNGDAPAVAARQALDWVRQELRYQKGATHVATTAADALAAGGGVCQDFAHLALSVLRTMGIPARYVSGYLHSAPDAGIGETISGESHAWVEYWTGQWRGFDVTNGVPVGERHVIVARGRDYGDVPPLKGIYHGGPADQLGVTVELTRVG